jgi:hypothetical protein
MRAAAIRTNNDAASRRSSAQVCTVAKQRPDRTNASSMSPMLGKLMVKMIFRWGD